MPLLPLRVGDDAAGRRPDADHVNGNPARLRPRDRLLDLPAPRLAVAHQHEGARIRRTPADLLVFLDHPQAPVDPALDVRVPRPVVRQAKRRLPVEMVEEEEEGVGIARQADLRRRDVGEQREGDPVVLPAQGLAERPEERHRSLPAVAPHVGDAHRRGTVLQDDDVDAGGADERDDGLWPRQGHDRAGERPGQAAPEHEVADARDALADGHAARATQAPGVADATREAPGDEHSTHRRHHQQRQPVGGAEAQVRDVEGSGHQGPHATKACGPGPNDARRYDVTRPAGAPYEPACGMARPTSTLGSTPALGLNFCGRPTCTSAV